MIVRYINVHLIIIIIIISTDALQWRIVGRLKLSSAQCASQFGYRLVCTWACLCVLCSWICWWGFRKLLGLLTQTAVRSQAVWRCRPSPEQLTGHVMSVSRLQRNQLLTLTLYCWLTDWACCRLMAYLFVYIVVVVLVSRIGCKQCLAFSASDLTESCESVGENVNRCVTAFTWIHVTVSIDGQ